MAGRLYDILDYETGDSWNGTHGRIITIEAEGNKFVVVSENALHEHEKRRATFTLDEIREQWEGAKDARYYQDFCAEAVGRIPGVMGIPGHHGAVSDIYFPADIPPLVSAGLSTEVSLPRRTIRLKGRKR
jgi:hypothetical protein